MRRPIAIAVVLLALVLAGHAPAAGEPPVLTGSGADDKAVDFEIYVDGKVKKGAVSGEIPLVRMLNAKFECEFEGGPSGRNDYTWGSLPNENAAKIKKNGKFKMVDEHESSDGRYVLDRYPLEGKAKVKGKKVTLTGTFQAELSEGGLEFGGCVTQPEGFKLKGKL
jgi:hypothetical protein